MNALKTVLGKELRAYFLSPVALIFLCIFLIANLFIFFTYSTFFARNIADVRPMFQWLPILLIFLVAAISMRSWSEEQAGGTLEILMTMPVKTWTLVAGKLAAGMVLVSVALALTLPLPIMVAFLGDIDVGPVVGGYVGALFLGTAYLSIGMCISARTDNQIVSLMVTAVVGALFYIIGSDTLVSFFGSSTGEWLRALGSGSRFYNIERGVLDVRDIFYYVSIATFFIALNIHFIDMKRVDMVKPQGRTRAAAKMFTVALIALNMLVANIWLAPVNAARADLTEDGQFSISGSTEKILEGLTEPVMISGYFSEKTHPLLAPLVPAIRDFLAEYENAGGRKVIVKFENPNSDEELEQEVAQSYNIRPLPFRVAAKHEQSVVNAYFHILIKYGDEYEVLSIDNLVEISQNTDDVDVRLRNLEYDITKAIKKVSSGFLSIESVFASMEETAKLTFFVTPDSIPEDMKEMPEQIASVASELAEKSDGKFKFEEVDLSGNVPAQQEAMDKYGFQPMATDIFAENTFFMHMLLETGGKEQQIRLSGTPTAAAIKSAIEGSFKRSTPGFIKTVGLFTKKPEQTPPNPQMPPQMQPPQEQPDFRAFERQLSQEFKVQRVDLMDGQVPGNIDILVISKPGTMTENQKFAADQFLMGGGAVIAMVGDREIKADRSGVTAQLADSGLKELLKTYGVNINSGFIMDSQNANFPVPVQEKRGMFVMRKIKMMDYPFFPDIRTDGFKEGHMATTGLQNVIFNWGSAISIEEQKGISADVVLSTSDKAWERTSTEVLPTSFEDATVEFAAPDEVEQFALAATLEGNFKSYYSDKPSPLFKDEAPPITEAPADDTKKKDLTGRTLKESVGSPRLAVVGSSELLSDLAANVGDQAGGQAFRSNFQFARNLIDWALADTDLLEIRTGGTFARTLAPLEDGQSRMWEIAHYIFVLFALGMVVAVSIGRRRNAKSLLETESKK